MYIIILIILLACGFIIKYKYFNNETLKTNTSKVKTAFNTSNSDAAIYSALEKKHISNFITDYPNFTEEAIKDLFKSYSVYLIQKETKEYFTSEVNKKIITDTMLDKIKNLIYRNTYINSYKKGKIIATVIYTDEIYDYSIYLYCDIIEEILQLENYKIEQIKIAGI